MSLGYFIRIDRAATYIEVNNGLKCGAVDFTSYNNLRFMDCLRSARFERWRKTQLSEKLCVGEGIL